MQDEILKDNYINYNGLVEEGGIIHPSVSTESEIYGCKRADIELSTYAVMKLLKRTKDVPVSTFKGDLSKKEIVKYIMTFFTRFFDSDLDLSVRKESKLGHLKDEKTKKTIKGVSKKHLGKLTVKYNVKEKVGNGGAVESKKSSKENGYISKEIRIDGKPSYLTIPVLAHEYAHVLAFRTQKSIENYTNIETIPMLIEHLVLYDAIQNEKDVTRLSLLNQAAKYHHIDRYNHMVTDIKKTVVFLNNRKKNVEERIEFDIHNSKSLAYISRMKSILESYKKGEDVYDKEDDVNVVLKDNSTYTENINPQPYISIDKDRLSGTDVSGVYVHGIGALYAYGLFDKFVSMNAENQISFKKILCDCLNGNKTIEQMIDEYKVVIDRELVDRYTNQMKKYSNEILDRDSSR